MKQQIKNRWTGKVLYECKADDVLSAVIAAIAEGKSLSGANLVRANLSRANLSGANLVGADLARAYLAGAKMVGLPLFIGPIGSRSDYVGFYPTDSGIIVKTGCFDGTMEQFVAAVEKTHRNSQHAKDYLAACELAKQVLAGRAQKEGAK